MDADPDLPKWKAGHLAKNYALFAEHAAWIKSEVARWADLVKKAGLDKK